MSDDNSSLFRKKSVDRLSSPEQLDDYLHVTTPTMWAVLAAAILILAGLLLWSRFAVIESFASGTASVDKGLLTITFDDPETAQRVEPGMTVSIGDTQASIASVGTDSLGNTIATANAIIPDGVYEARVGYRQTQMIKILFN